MDWGVERGRVEPGGRKKSASLEKTELSCWTISRKILRPEKKGRFGRLGVGEGSRIRARKTRCGSHKEGPGENSQVPEIRSLVFALSLFLSGRVTVLDQSAPCNLWASFLLCDVLDGP